ncbi:hypothetical protein OESDEN_10446 [Oesophagostomum dentatum]|uniref:VWFA domain-containing protein n=1 Tax=Oesophagostomum dentatum TaxID=61180 RepID=A0A0B1SXN2_OESDE|nr:hypothetical protein OESDEN_10446 [Oesophagostomum dentatum]
MVTFQNSTADSKNIVIFSDGDQDICAYNHPAEDCPQWKRDNITAHSQESEAEAVHKLGIKVTFVAVNARKSNPRIMKIAGKPENIVDVNSFTDFNAQALNGVIKSVCKPEKLVDLTDATTGR